MISSLETKNDSTDIFSFAGKLALAAGTGYGLYKTHREMGKPLANFIQPSNYISKFTNVYKTPTSQFIKNKVDFKPVSVAQFVDSLEPTYKVVDANLADKGKFSSMMGELSPDLRTKAQSLIDKISGDYGYGTHIDIRSVYTADGRLSEFNMIPRSGIKTTTFSVLPVNQSGDVLIAKPSPRTYASSWVLSDSGEIVKSDIATLGEYEKTLSKSLMPYGQNPREFNSTSNPKDIYQTMKQKLIFEGTPGVSDKEIATLQESGFGRNENIAALKKSTIHISPMGDVRKDVVQSRLLQAIKDKGLTPGTGEMTEEGQAFLPGSLVEQFIGGGFNFTSKKGIRPTEFIRGGKKPTISSALGTKSLREFEAASVNADKFAEFQAALRQEIGSVESQITAQEKILEGVDASLNYAKVNPVTNSYFGINPPGQSNFVRKIKDLKSQGKDTTYYEEKLLGVDDRRLELERMGGIHKKHISKLYKRKKELEGYRANLAAEEMLIQEGSIVASNKLNVHHVKRSGLSEEFDTVLNQMTSDIAATQIGFTKQDLFNMMNRGELSEELGRLAAGGKKYYVTGLNLGRSAQSAEEEYENVNRDVNSYLRDIRLLPGKREKELAVSLTSEWDAGEGQKFFSGFKGTAHTTPFSVANLLRNYDYYLNNHKIASSIKDLDKKKWGHVDVLLGEHPTAKFLSEGVIGQKEFSNALTIWSTKLARKNTPEAEEVLRALGLQKDGKRWSVPEGVRTEKQIEGLFNWARSKGIEGEDIHRNITALIGDEILPPAGEEIAVNPILLSLEQHGSQSGFNKMGSVSERVLSAITATYPEEVAADIRSRMTYSGPSPASQSEEMQKYLSLMTDKTKEAIPLSRLQNAKINRNGVLISPTQGELLDALFDQNLERRKALISELGGKDNLVIALGDSAAETEHHKLIDRLVISSSEELEPHIGRGISIGGETVAGDLDVQTRRILELALNRNKNTPALQFAATELDENIKTISKTFVKSSFKGRVSGSVFAQAQSELPGMAEWGKEALRKRAGDLYGGQEVFVAAMHNPDIAKGYASQISESMLDQGRIKAINEKYGSGSETAEKMIRRMKGRKAVELAETIGIPIAVTREPAEGVVRVVPGLLTSAEKFGAKTRGHNPGTAYVTSLQSHKPYLTSLGLDFDRDPLTVIGMVNQDKALTAAMAGGEGFAAEAGRAYRDTLSSIFTYYNPKTKGTQDAFKMYYEGGALKVNEMSYAMGKTEKGMIGLLSTALEPVHMGLRTGLSKSPTFDEWRKFYRTDTLGLLIAENALKSKVLPEHALLGDTLPKLLETINPNSNMSTESRIAGTRGFLDMITFKEGESGLGNEIRAARGQFSEDLLNRIVSSSKVKKEDVHGFANVYNELTSDETMSHFFDAQRVGHGLSQEQLKLALAKGESILAPHATAMATQGKNLFGRALKNVGKYGLLPAAGIGLAATLLTSPKEVPVSLATKEHESSSRVREQVRFPRTKYSIPGKQRVQIKGRVSDVPDPSSLSSYFNTPNVNMNIKDFRQHMTQDYIDRKVNRGH